MLLTAERTVIRFAMLAPVAEAATGHMAWASPLLGFCLTALVLVVAAWWRRKDIADIIGVDPVGFLMNNTFPKRAQTSQPNTVARGGATQQSNPLSNHNVRLASTSDSPSSGTANQREEMRAILREVVREELAKLRSEISADLQGSLQALAERMNGLQAAQRPAPTEPRPVEPPAPRPVQRAVTETELLSFWRTLRDTNQVSATHIQALAAKNGLTVSEAPGLASSDPLYRLGFLLSNGQDTIWFIPRPAFQRSELQGVYNFPPNAYLPGAISEVVRFARWQGGQIVAPGEAN